MHMWEYLESFPGPSGEPLDILGPALVGQGQLLGSLGAPLEASGKPWEHLGTVYAILGPLGSFSGAPGEPLGPLEPALGGPGQFMGILGTRSEAYGPKGVSFGGHGDPLCSRDFWGVPSSPEDVYANRYFEYVSRCMHSLLLRAFEPSVLSLDRGQKN